MDYLKHVRDAPGRASDAKSSRVRTGTLGDGPEGKIGPVLAEGVTDFARRWSYVSQAPLLEPQAGARGARRSHGLTRLLGEALATPQTLIFIDGTVFTRQPDRAFSTVGGSSPYAPRHPNDPAWYIDILYGARSPIQHEGTTTVDGSTLIHLSGTANLDAADRASPNGVRRPLRGRRAPHRSLGPRGHRPLLLRGSRSRPGGVRYPTLTDCRRNPRECRNRSIRHPGGAATCFQRGRDVLEQDHEM
jgi:hypothetical protein